MRVPLRVAVAGVSALTTAGLVGAVGTTPAQAAVHRGHTACINWSWGDNKSKNITVYFHSHCSRTRALHIRFSKGYGPVVNECVNVHARIKGKKKFWYVPNKVSKVWETSKC
ncbi:hypothetical protein [Actinomadura fibrosa]|uniref:Secreted protein n=1 Tax=Actinomadura fibrosa TaxID=111802 RepID=A0ABW2XIF4_9ACTN|nr:hypothetical protein [Actinomadura fibrosa]